MQLWVLAANKLLDALKGAGGSVRALARYPGPEPWMASVGLDRFLRIHDASSKAGKARVYLKQQLTAVAWLPVQQQQQAPSDAAAAAVSAAAAAAAEGEEGAAGEAEGEAAVGVKRKKGRSKAKSGVAGSSAAGGQGLKKHRVKKHHVDGDV
jgi:ribosome biogenesis protein NSA1